MRIPGKLAIEARQKRVVVLGGAATAAFRIAPHQGRQFDTLRSSVQFSSDSEVAQSARERRPSPEPKPEDAAAG